MHEGQLISWNHSIWKHGQKFPTIWSIATAPIQQDGYVPKVFWNFYKKKAYKEFFIFSALPPGQSHLFDVQMFSLETTEKNYFCLGWKQKRLSSFILLPLKVGANIHKQKAVCISKKVYCKTKNLGNKNEKRKHNGLQGFVHCLSNFPRHIK